MNVWAIWVSLAAHYAREQAFARQQVHFCVDVEMFMSKCFLSHPVRDMYHTLIRLLKVKQEIRARFMIKTKCMKTIYGSTEIRTCIWQKDPNCSSALHEEANRQSLFSESLVNSRALGLRTDPTQPCDECLLRGAQPFKSPVIHQDRVANVRTWFLHVTPTCEHLRSGALEWPLTLQHPVENTKVTKK